MEDNKKSNAGKPPIIKAPEEMQLIIDKYFEKCTPEMLKDENGGMVTDKKGNPVWKLNSPTLTGLALVLGFASRQSIYDYEKKDEYSYIIKRARLTCENYAEKGLLDGTIPVAGGIFILKNYGWRDDYGLVGDKDNPIHIDMSDLRKKIKDRISDKKDDKCH